jgi:hypothetical protein
MTYTRPSSTNRPSAVLDQMHRRAPRVRDADPGDLETRIECLEDAVHELADICKVLAGGRDEGDLDSSDHRLRHTWREVDAANHPPVGAIKSMSDYQRMLNEHYERERGQALKPAQVGDWAAGVRDAAIWNMWRGVH